MSYLSCMIFFCFVLVILLTLFVLLKLGCPLKSQLSFVIPKGTINFTDHPILIVLLVSHFFSVSHYSYLSRWLQYWSLYTSHSKNVINLTNCMGLNQIICEPTHFSHSGSPPLIDLFFHFCPFLPFVFSSSYFLFQSFMYPLFSAFWLKRS